MNLAAQIYLYIVNKMGQVLNSAGPALTNWGSKVSKEFNKVAGRTFGVAQAFTFIKGSMEESLNRAKQFINLGKRMGMPADEVAKLERYAEQAGINVTSLGRGMTSLSKNAGMALGDMNSKMGGLARQLGLTREQLYKIRGGGLEAFVEVRRAMDSVQSAGQRQQIWIQLLGERYTELREFVEMTADEMEEMIEKQTGMSAPTIESVGETQKAWGNMFADLSVLIADFLRDCEPIVGIIRVVLNLIMTIARVVMWLFGMLSSGIQIVLGGIVDVVRALYALATGDFKMLWKTADGFVKRMGDAWKKSKAAYKGVESDWEGAKAGLGQIIGERYSVDMPNKRPVEQVLADRRTGEDVFEYEKQLKLQEAIERKREDSLLQDEAKIDNLKKIVELNEHEARLIQEKYGVNYKETKEYLEYLNKREDKLKEIANLEYELAKKRYDTSVSWIDLANEYYLKEMELTYKSEAEIREAKARQAADKIELLQRELEKMQADSKYYSEADIAKKQQEIYKLAMDTTNMLRKPIDNVDYKATSLQSVGGGGAVSLAAVSIAKAQLMQQQESNRWLQIMAEKIDQSGAQQAMEYGAYYARTIGGGRR